MTGKTSSAFSVSDSCGLLSVRDPAAASRDRQRSASEYPKVNIQDISEISCSLNFFRHSANSSVYACHSYS